MTGFYVDGFYFYFDEWVLILLMIDEWGLLMVDEWWLGFSVFVVDGFVGFFVFMLMVDLCVSFWLIWIFGSGCGRLCSLNLSVSIQNRYIILL